MLHGTVYRLHISTAQYARLVRDRVTSGGLEPSAYSARAVQRRRPHGMSASLTGQGRHQVSSELPESAQRVVDQR